MKSVWLVSIVVLLILGVGMLFVFGDKVLNTTNGRGFSEMDFEEDKEGYIENPGVLSGGDEDIFVEDGELNESSLGVVCGTQPVQYSLRNFVEDMDCLDGVDSNCVRARINCSVEIYNFDKSVDDLFIVEFSLTNLEEEKLESYVLERLVRVGTSEVLVHEFFYEGVFDVGELGCGVAMNGVPRKCI